MAERLTTPDLHSSEARARADIISNRMAEDDKTTHDALTQVGIGIQQRFAKRAKELLALGAFPTVTVVGFEEEEDEGEEIEMQVKGLWVEQSENNIAIVMGENGYLHEGRVEVNGMGEAGRLYRGEIQRVSYRDYPHYVSSVHRAIQERLDDVTGRTAEREEEKRRAHKEVVLAEKRRRIRVGESLFAGKSDLRRGEGDSIGERANQFLAHEEKIRALAALPTSAISVEQVNAVLDHMYRALEYDGEVSEETSRWIEDGSVVVIMSAGEFIGVRDPKIGEELYSLGNNLWNADAAVTFRVCRSHSIPLQEKPESREIYEALGRSEFAKGIYKMQGFYTAYDGQSPVGDRNLSFDGGEVIEWLLQPSQGDPVKDVVISQEE